MHLRLGDVFEEGCDVGSRGTDWSVADLLHGTLKAKKLDVLEIYTLSLAYYARQLDVLEPYRARGELSHLVIVGGSHLDLHGGYPRSSEYINGLRDFFVSRGYTVSLRLGHLPDPDLVYMARARFFVQGGGGYSLLISEIVKAMGGLVLCNDHQYECAR